MIQTAKTKSNWMQNETKMGNYEVEGDDWDMKLGELYCMSVCGWTGLSLITISNCYLWSQVEVHQQFEELGFWI